MSRNRPRGGPGRENLEEAGLWQKVIQDIKGAKELNDQQMDLGQRITALNEKIIRDGNSKCPLSPPFVQGIDMFCSYLPISYLRHGYWLPNFPFLLIPRHWIQDVANVADSGLAGY
jgi:hypothetical protein